jgi:RNA polymerase sigma-70 factor (ECF subfamily)
VDERDDELIPTRATLILRLKDWQDQASWQEFFDTYWQLIFKFAIKRGLTPDEAGDVVQETMIAVARHMPAFKYDPLLGSFKTWLLNMTSWRVTDQLRLRPLATPPNKPAADHLPEDDHPSPPTEHIPPDLEKLWDEEWENNLLAAAITNARRRLDPKQYQIYDFNVNKEWPAERVAQAFAIPVSQVYLAKHRVTELIKAEAERLKKDII